MNNRINVFTFRVLLQRGKSKIDAKDKDGFTPLLRCCQESPMAKDDPNESEAKKTEDKSNQDNFRAEIIKLLVGKGANMKAKGNFLPFFYEMT